MSSRTTIEMARCFRDRREALSLIHSAHVRAGLPSRSENALRVTRHQLLPRSRIFVAKSDGRVVSTLSLVPDNPMGLPLDEQCRVHVDQFRARGLCLAEVGSFADRRQERGRFVENFCALMRFVAQYACAQGIDGLLIAGHPQCRRLLKSILGFRDELARQAISPVAGARTATPLFLEFERLKRESPSKHQAYFGDSVPPKEFTGGFMPRWEADYFGRPGAVETSSPAGLAPSADRLSALCEF
jgi:hypothetical protein